MTPAVLIPLIQAVLSPDLLKPGYRSMHDPENPTAGHCYHAAEALWHLLDGRASGWTPYVHREEDGVTHWWLRHRDGTIADPTAAQYQGDPLPYDRGLGKGCGFLTYWPSQRAQSIIDRIIGGVIFSGECQPA
jgi:hypothetical protein